MPGPIVGVDLGGTQIRAVLAQSDGTILARYKTLTEPQDGAKAVLGRVMQAIEAVRRESFPCPHGIGVGTPGTLDPATGTVLEATNLSWRNVPLRHILEDRFDLPAAVANDANAAALAERLYGGGQGADDLVYMTVSTGIGGGIISGGRLLLGAHGLAGEIGHMVVEPYGPRCKCGNIGCLEVLASGPAIAAEAVTRIERGQASIIAHLIQGDMQRVSAEVVARAAAGGDTLATSVIQQAAFYIGIGVVSLIHILEPQVILIGGGVAHIGDLLFDTIRATVRERAIPSMAQSIRIEPAALGEDAGVLGAIAVFLEHTHE